MAVWTRVMTFSTLPMPTGSNNPLTTRFTDGCHFSHIQYAGNDTYTSKAGYMNFASYTVENRERVKVVDGTHGVPISTQVRLTRPVKKLSTNGPLQLLNNYLVVARWLFLSDSNRPVRPGRLY